MLTNQGVHAVRKIKRDYQNSKEDYQIPATKAVLKKKALEEKKDLRILVPELAIEEEIKEQIIPEHTSRGVRRMNRDYTNSEAKELVKRKRHLMLPTFGLNKLQ